MRCSGGGEQLPDDVKGGRLAVPRHNLSGAIVGEPGHKDVLRYFTSTVDIAVKGEGVNSCLEGERLIRSPLPPRTAVKSIRRVIQRLEKQGAPPFPVCGWVDSEGMYSLVWLHVTLFKSFIFIGTGGARRMMS